MLSWWYDYWTARVITDRMLRAFAGALPRTACLQYDFTYDSGETRRQLWIHGSRRFAISPPQETPKLSQDAPRQPEGAPKPRFRAEAPKRRLRSEELLELLATRSDGGGPQSATLRQLVMLYGTTLALVPLLGIAVTAWLTHRGAQHALVIATSPASSLSTSSVLFDEAACSAHRPVILVAASGGGTRAALYTASVLNGLQRIDHLQDVRLVSGVSGGGMALASLASRRPDLLRGEDATWDSYFESMRHAYIEDVARSASEWRVMTGTRFGSLSAESFSRRWGLPNRSKLGEIDLPGLILNSSIAGTYECQRCNTSAEPGHSDSLEVLESRHPKERKSALAAGRLDLSRI